MNKFVGPATIAGIIGVLLIAIGGSAYAAIGDSAEDELLGGPDQRTISPPPAIAPKPQPLAPAKRAEAKPTPAPKPIPAKPVSKAAPLQQAQTTVRPTPRQVQAPATVKPAPLQAQAQVKPVSPPRPAPVVAAAPPSPAPPPVTPPPVTQRNSTPEDLPPPPQGEERAQRDYAARNDDEPDINRGEEIDPDYAERGEPEQEFADDDFASLEQSIDRGLRRGDFGRRQAQGLYGELDDIADMREQFRRAGGIGPREQAALDERLDDLRARIEGAIRDDEGWRGRYRRR